MTSKHNHSKNFVILPSGATMQLYTSDNCKFPLGFKKPKHSRPVVINHFTPSTSSKNHIFASTHLANKTVCQDINYHLSFSCHVLLSIAHIPPGNTCRRLKITALDYIFSRYQRSNTGSQIDHYGLFRYNKIQVVLVLRPQMMHPFISLIHQETIIWY